jgi:hypothetical protein
MSSTECPKCGTANWKETQTCTGCGQPPHARPLQVLGPRGAVIVWAASVVAFLIVWAIFRQ